MKKALVILVIVLISALTATAGKLTDGLRAAYNQSPSVEWQPVLIALSNRTSASEALIGYETAGLEMAHSRVMELLLANASFMQSPVRNTLGNLESTGQARNVRSLWIANIIAAELTQSAAEQLSNMPEVDEIGLDEPITLRKMLEVTPDDGSAAAEGLIAAGALDAWMAGYRGEGRIVCVLGDGFNANHPLLAGNWRGRNSPVGQCWFDVSGSATPSSCGGETAQMLGLACGSAVGSAPATGVAPSAQWIAANVFCNSPRLSDILTAMQWAVDTDGNGATLDDVPDVIVSAWQLNAACRGGEPFAVWEAFSNAEAMGPVVLFAAGQDGERGAGSVVSPASHVTCFSVGFADMQGGRVAIHPASGRGPSPCDGKTIKPDLVAPGTRVVTMGESGRVRVTGSAAAAAYVAGAVALIRQVNPSLRAGEIKRILTTGATDAGSPGPDNTFGHGILNVAHAVMKATTRERTGTLRVAARYGGTSVSDVRITISGAFGDRVESTDGGDAILEHLAAGRNYALRAGRFGYKLYRHDDSVTVQSGTSVNVFLDLERGFHDDAEYDQGWSLGVRGDDATSGTWARAVPVGSKVQGRIVQPDRDASPEGTYCFVTGNASSADDEGSTADVDGGRTTLRSPLFSLTEIEEPVIQFSYWYSNDRGANPGEDFFRAQISSDGGTTWKDLMSTSASTNGWLEVSFPVRTFAEPGDRMMLQFVAEDYEPGSLVEAAVDEIRVTGSPSAPEPPRGLTLDIQFNQVVLKWLPSPGARAYRVYLSGERNKIVAPENLYAVVSDTTLTVPLSDIPYEQFYFQVTAVK
ncbi:S8 family serine peptidase [bacterium]|nr:S8 family serine peptidase [bacterium]MBU1983766.1 S8 family serine peptidase [bacterium]